MITNKNINRAILVFCIGLVALYFLIQNSLLNLDYKIPHQLNSISQAAQKDQWLEARKFLSEFEQTWGRGKHFIAFNYSEPDYLIFTEDLVRLRQAIKMRDAQEVGVSTAGMKELWTNFSKLVPLP